MKLIVSVILILLTFFYLVGDSPFGHQSPLYVKLAHKITEQTAKQLKAEKNLYLAGTGGQMMDDIQMMSMSFDYYQEVTIETARELIVYAINKYLLEINNNTKIRPYLHEYPFAAENVEIAIFVSKPDRSEVALEQIDCISSIKGIIKYYARSNFRQAICQESYDEAVRTLGSK